MYKLSFLLKFIFFLFVFSACRENNDKNDADSALIFEESDLRKINWDEFDFYPTSTTGQVVKHKFFSLSYHEDFEQAEWVAYELKASNSFKSDFKRPYFIDDPKVKTGSADWKNYKNSGYDKGHLCPAGDMKFSIDAYNETFYTSNISPQKADFNAGVWNRLEQKVRYWADKYDGLYVVTGGILTNNLKTIGKEKVAIPDYFYKVLLDVSKDKPRMIAFLVPHKNSNQPLYEFVVSVDELEELTGIDFFPHLPDDMENTIEKNINYKSWSFNSLQ
ncbi:DNA/RNA non-specific endonuclease [Flavobacterium sp.]|uniref:DNA/RNA non-specific endonuclease n=1 Tax=Flavobacterium sp. TaxID=239 RepID=UPI0035292B55